MSLPDKYLEDMKKFLQDLGIECKSQDTTDTNENFIAAIIHKNK